MTVSVTVSELIRICDDFVIVYFCLVSNLPSETELFSFIRSMNSVFNRILNWYQSYGTDLNDLTVVWINHSSFFRFSDVKFSFWLKGWNPRNPRFLIEPKIMWLLHVFVNSRVRFSFPYLSVQVSSSNSNNQSVYGLICRKYWRRTRFYANGRICSRFDPSRRF